VAESLHGYNHNVPIVAHRLCNTVQDSTETCIICDTVYCKTLLSLKLLSDDSNMINLVFCLVHWHLSQWMNSDSPSVVWSCLQSSINSYINGIAAKAL